MTDTKKPTVQEIRADKDLGRGSCSSVDECYTDAELQQWIDELDPAVVGDVLEFIRRIDREKLQRMDGGY